MVSTSWHRLLSVVAYSRSTLAQMNERLETSLLNIIAPVKDLETQGAWQSQLRTGIY